MITFKNPSTDPYFNLAAEQYLLDLSLGEEIFMLWRNSPAVIIGKNQNAAAEINSEYVRKNNIAVTRRLTGGGAVFHDLGNVNFTFISPKTGEIDFSSFTKPVIKALCDLGLDASLSGRNDIVVSGMKISGNAQCRYNNQTMHHGTLLFSADLSRVAASLTPRADKLFAKGIKSVASRVANISDMLDSRMDVTAFSDYLTEAVGNAPAPLPECYIDGIKKLADEKYSSWDWVYGKSRDFSITRRKRFDFGEVTVSLTADRGIITDISFGGDFFGVCEISGLENTLIGVKLDYSEITAILSDMKIRDYIAGSTPEEIAALISG